MNPELYISVDIETSGPIPGEYSMLSIGACVVGNSAENFYVELAPLNDNFTDEAMAMCNISLAQLRAHGTAPDAAMEQFTRWLNELQDGARVIFAGFNAPFDWSFVNYYFIKFCGPGKNPFGHSAIDIKSYYMGAYKTSWARTSMRHISPNNPLPHNALQDAILQANIFAGLLGRTD